MTTSDLFYHFNREIESWKCTLNFLQTENIRLKTEIAELGSYTLSAELLGIAENFQQDFLNADEMIRLTRYDIRKFQDLIETKHDNGDDISQTFLVQKGLHHYIETIAHHLEKLKSDFNTYLEKTYDS